MDRQFISITENNKGYFSNLIPEELLDFSNNNSYYGVLTEGTAAGMCVVSVNRDRNCLEYIYIAKEYRRNRLATWMLGEIMSIYGDELLISYNEDNEALCAFSKSIGARELDSYTLYKYMMSDVMNEDTFVMKLRKRMSLSNVIYFDKKTSMDDYELSMFLRKNTDMGHYFLQRNNTPRYSCIYKKTSVEAFVTCTLVENTLSIDMIYNTNKNEKTLLELLIAVLDRVIKEKEDIKYVRMLAVNEKIANLAKYLIGDVQAEEHKTVVAKVGL